MLATPFGTLVGPNITPDPDAGIGAWTDDEFVAALHDGRGRGGVRLYPAMPYPAYTKMSREDALAIRAYLQTIEPAPDKIQPNQLPFPFDIRSDHGGVECVEFQARPAPAGPVEIRRMEPRALSRRCARPLRHMSYAEDDLGRRQGFSLSSRRALQAGLRQTSRRTAGKGIGRWSVEEIVGYLKTGANSDNIATGDMSEEIVHSSSHMTDDDVKAIAVYLKSLKPASKIAPQPIAASDRRMVAGQAIYKDNCAGCHTDAGTGSAGLFARLAGSHAVQSDDPTTLIRVVLEGSQGVGTAGAPTGPAMPSFGWRLNDAQVATVLTYIRNAWGNAATAVAADQVKAVRASLTSGANLGRNPSRAFDRC